MFLNQSLFLVISSPPIVVVEEEELVRSSFAIDPYLNFQESYLRFDALTVSEIGTAPVYDDECNSWSVTGTPMFDGSVFKFGKSSILFDGSGDFLKCADASRFNLSANDFTIEAWVRITATPGVSRYYTICGKRDLAGADNSFALMLDESDGHPIFQYTTNGTTVVEVNGPAGTLSLNTWHHVAVARRGTSLWVFLNGTPGTVHNISGAIIWSNTAAFQIGRADANAGAGTTADFAGYIDDFRFTGGYARYVKAFTAPTAAFGEAYHDPYSTDLASLLHFDGTDGATTTTDTTGKTWTFNGNAQLDVDQRKYGNTSLKLDGSGDYISTSQIISGAGDWTIECWIRWDGTFPDAGSSMSPIIYSQYSHTGGGLPADRFTFFIQLNTGFLGSQLGSTSAVGSTPITAGVWHRVAICRMANVHSLFLDGIFQNSYTTTTSPQATTSRIGAQLVSNVINGEFPGHIDEFRITQDVARYMPNAPSLGSELLTTTDPWWSMVKSQLRFNGTDGSTTFTEDTALRTWTAAGNAQLDTAEKKFGSASLLLDGNGDYATTPDHADFALGAHDFTIECWIRPTSVTGSNEFRGILTQKTNFNTSNAFSLHQTANDDGFTMALSSTGNGATSNAITFESMPVVANVWLHIAAVRRGSKMLFFRDSVLTDEREIGDLTVFDSTSVINIGRLEGDDIGTVNYFAGHIDDLRFTKGVARYGRDYAPLIVNYDNGVKPVVTMLNFNGADASTTFTDESGKTWTPAGNAQIDTAQSKYGGASGLFDGSGDYLSTPDHADFDLAASDFTIEAWIRPTGTYGANRGIISHRTSAASNHAFTMRLGTTGQLIFEYTLNGSTLAQVLSPVVITLNAWTHVAAVRHDSVLALYLNGVLDSTVAISGTIFNSTAIVTIGADSAGVTDPWNGWIDDLRITRAALYTGDYFTPPRALERALVDFTNRCDDPYAAYVVALLHMNGTDASTTFTDETGKVWTANGNAQIDTAQSKFGGASGLFDGTGDFLRTPDHADFDFGDEDFTIEGFCYHSTATIGTYKCLASKWTDISGTGSNNRSWSLGVTSTNVTFFHSTTGVNSAALSWTWTPITQQWFYLTLTRQAGVLRAFINGVQLVGTHTVSATFSGTAPTVIGGHGAVPSAPLNVWNGWLDELRITVGYARYTENFDVPTAAFPDP